MLRIVRWGWGLGMGMMGSRLRVIDFALEVRMNELA